MVISDVLRLNEGKPMKDFAEGQLIMEHINDSLPLSEQITLDLTTDKVMDKLNRVVSASLAKNLLSTDYEELVKKKEAVTDKTKSYDPNQSLARYKIMLLVCALIVLFCITALFYSSYTGNDINFQSLTDLINKCLDLLIQI